MTLTNWKFTKGLRDLGNGCCGCIVPDGSRGWSNAGLIPETASPASGLLRSMVASTHVARAALSSFKRGLPLPSSIRTLCGFAIALRPSATATILQGLTSRSEGVSA